MAVEKLLINGHEFTFDVQPVQDGPSRHNLSVAPQGERQVVCARGEELRSSVSNHTGAGVQSENDSGERLVLTITNIHVDGASGEVFFDADGKPYRAHISDVLTDSSEQSSSILLSHVSHAIIAQKITSSMRVLPAITDKQQAGHEEGLLKSPLAGRVSRVLVSEGQSVEQGQQLILIESMKMENEICAPYHTFIKTIFIAEGSVVQPNQPLIEFGIEGEYDAAAQNEHEQKAVSHR